MAGLSEHSSDQDAEGSQLQDTQPDAPVSGSTAAKKKKKKSKGKKHESPPALLAPEQQLPWKVSTSQRLGRHGLSKQALTAGQLLLLEDPVICIVLPDSTSTVCHHCLQDISAAQKGRPTQAGGRCFCSTECASAQPKYSPALEAARKLLPRIAKQHDTDTILLQSVLELQALQFRLHTPPDAATLSSDSPSEQQGCSHSSQGSSEPQAHHSKPHDCSMSSLSLSDSNTAATEASDTSAAESAQAGPQHTESSRAAESQPEGHEASTERQAEGTEEHFPVLRCGIHDATLLLSHLDKQSAAWQHTVGAACQELHRLLVGRAGQGLADAQQMLEWASIVHSNIHGTGTDDTNQDKAIGLYPGLSMLNHSCQPNCSWSPAGGARVQIRALTDIAAGEQLTVSYTNLMEPRATRQADLLRSKHFACACLRCRQPLTESPDRFLEGVNCTSTSCPGLLLGNIAGGPEELKQPWKCTDCGKEVPARSPGGTGPLDLHQTALATWQQIHMQSRNYPHHKIRPLWEAQLRQFGGGPGKLNDCHVALFDCLLPLMNSCRATGDDAAAISHLQSVLSIYARVLPLPIPELGNFNALLGMLLAQKAAQSPPALRSRARKAVRDTLNHAANIRRINLGASHPKTLETEAQAKVCG